MRLAGDISAWQTHNYEWTARLGYNLDQYAGAVDAAWIRWTDWKGYVKWGADPDYAHCIDYLRDVHNKCVGGYLYPRPGTSDPVTQIAAWRAATPATTWAPMLDPESNDGLSGPDFSRWVDVALAETAQRFQRIPWLYTNERLVREYGLTRPSTPHLLMIAGGHWYDTTFPWGQRGGWEGTAMSQQPPLPAGWGHWDAWQFSQKGEVPGMVGLTDVSLVTEDAFAQSGGGADGGFNDMERDLLRSLGGH